MGTTMDDLEADVRREVRDESGRDAYGSDEEWLRDLSYEQVPMHTSTILAVLNSDFGLMYEEPGREIRTPMDAILGAISDRLQVIAADEWRLIQEEREDAEANELSG